ncbi:hypothetical protein [Bergeriella denitrificans]|uniref:Integral membrane protein n=1 Tax=Bergeriella denitrificans TaxID=494 RepID=A0A378UIH5_BERDE|nr:hypothetical protein [Bergeriella denitrificans]STZ77095.1 integral membrane protein [Bergeriella denitrificans]
MNTLEAHPYRAFTLAVMLLALPLALLLHEAVSFGLLQRPGLWLAPAGGVWPSENTADAATAWVFGVLFFFSLLIGSGLARLACNKMLRRRLRHILFLCGAAACAASMLSLILLGILGEAALGGYAQTAVCYYTAAVGILSALLPRQLTRAPEQPVTFHKTKR